MRVFPSSLELGVLPQGFSLEIRDVGVLLELGLLSAQGCFLGDHRGGGELGPSFDRSATAGVRFPEDTALRDGLKRFRLGPGFTQTSLSHPYITKALKGLNLACDALASSRTSAVSSSIPRFSPELHLQRQAVVIDCVLQVKAKRRKITF